MRKQGNMCVKLLLTIKLIGDIQNITWVNAHLCTFFKELDRLHNQYVLHPADKAGNNNVFVYAALHINCIFKKLSFNSTLCNPTYTHSSLSRQKILQNHQSLLAIFNIPNKQNDFDLPYLYWIPKLHKDPYKHWYIAVSIKCFTKASFFTPYLNFYSCEGETSRELYSNTRIKNKSGKFRFIQHCWGSEIV